MRKNFVWQPAHAGEERKNEKQCEKTLDTIVNLCKNRGFVFPGSEIYGGLANSWDYGPLGVEFKNNVKKRLAEEIRAGKPLQRRAGCRHPDEPADLGHHRPRRRASPIL